MATNTAAKLTASQLSALQKHNRQETNLERIKVANRIRYQEGCADLQLAGPVPPERKLAFRLSDDLRPFLTRGSFVKVERRHDNSQSSCYY